MSLSDEFTARFSAADVLTLTNPGNPAATTVDSTRLGLAATDVQGDFVIYAGQAYDGALPEHVAVAIDRLEARLLDRKPGGAKDRMASTRILLEDLAKVGPRGRILPRTNMVDVPTSEQTYNGVTPRPDTDRTRFRDFIPGSPGTSDPYNR